DWLPRVLCNRLEGAPAAFRELERKRKTRERTTYPLRQLARTTQQNFWEIKLAERPKSFWYPYSTLRNVAVLEELCSKADVNLLEVPCCVLESWARMAKCCFVSTRIAR